MDTDIANLIAIVFGRSPPPHPVVVRFPDVGTTKELFYMLVDILCKGVVSLFGGANNVVDLKELTFEQFDEVRARMGCMGVGVHINTGQLETPRSGVDMTQVRGMPEMGSIEDYVCSINVIDSRHNIHFSITRGQLNTETPCCAFQQ